MTAIPGVPRVAPQVLAPYGARRLLLLRGEGVHLWDTEGRQYLDLAGNYGVALLGHAHPGITRAVQEQAGLLLSAHQGFDTPVRRAFLDALGALLPPSLTTTVLVNSGAESVEVALKMARAATGRTTVVAAHRGYHGRTLGALAATSDRRYREPFTDLLPGVRHVPFDDLDAVAAALGPEVAAVLVEPIQGEGGVRVPRPGYLAGLRALCDAHGALLVFDEVQTGFRTGAAFAFQHEGVVPDVLCLAKGIAGGLPLGVTVTTDAIAAQVSPTLHGSTFGGNPVACAAAGVVLAAVGDPALHARVTRSGAALREGLVALDHPAVREVRGRGLMLAVELRRNVAPVVRGLQERGVLVIGSGTAVRLLPPLTLDGADVHRALAAFESALSEV